MLDHLADAAVERSHWQIPAMTWVKP